MSTPEAVALLAELRRLAERFPLPHPIWHPYVAEMHAVVRDLFTALDAIAAVPGAPAELVQRIDGPDGPSPGGAGGPALAAARDRLHALPRPQGEHPYLDEILVALEAAAAALDALAEADGEAEFARALQGTTADRRSFTET
jgi:hypothetical protein